MSDFREIVKFKPFLSSKKIQTLKIWTYHFEARDLENQMFREKFKYRENISNKRFRKIHKSFLKIAKFEYFAKQIIYYIFKIMCFKMMYRMSMFYKSHMFFELPKMA